MKPKRRFSVDLKRNIVEELVSGSSSLAQLGRRYDISPGLISKWKEQYLEGKFSGEPQNVAELEAKIDKLEKLVARLALDNELLKKAAQHSHQKKNKNSSKIISGTLEGSSGGVK